MKFHIKKDDRVKVLAGDSKGQTGLVLEVDTKKQRAIVEGVNLISKHSKPNSKNPQGGIVKQEASIHISNLQKVEATKKAETKSKTKETKVKEATK
jgi:large subunit ribosomal protein L24